MKIEKRLENIVKENKIYDLFKDNILDKNILIEDYFKISKEKERNILINLTRYLKKNNKDINERFSEDEINENILLKKIDYLVYKDKIFTKCTLNIKKDKKEKIQKYLDNFNENKDYDGEEKLKKIYTNLKNMLERGEYNYNSFNGLIQEGIQLAKKLHWKYLPIYDEQTMKNRGCLPEDNIDEYYNHYHTIEDLYEETIGKEIKFDLLNGDETLNKEVDFKVYTVRWNSYDTYRVKRTIYGWEVRYLSILPKTLKDGTGGLFDNLRHDSVFFPEEGVAYAMEQIWDLADSGKLSFNEMKEKLEEVAVWISDVERNMRVKQPKWCNYY